MLCIHDPFVCVCVCVCVKTKQATPPSASHALAHVIYYIYSRKDSHRHCCFEVVKSIHTGFKTYPIRGSVHSLAARSLVAAGPMLGLPGLLTAASVWPVHVPKLPPIGISTEAWGDTRLGWGRTFNSSDLEAAYDALHARGLTYFDTSEVYGYQGQRFCESSEQILCSLADRHPERPTISTKCVPIPWVNLLSGGGLRLGRSSVLEALRNSLTRLGSSSVHARRAARLSQASTEFAHPTYMRRWTSTPSPRPCRSVGGASSLRARPMPTGWASSLASVPATSTRATYARRTRSARRSGCPCSRIRSDSRSSTWKRHAQAPESNGGRATPSFEPRASPNALLLARRVFSQLDHHPR